MRKILRAYRSNPIKPDAALELVEYAKKYGGYIRVTYKVKVKDKDGEDKEQEKKVLLRPEGLKGLVIRNIRQLLDAQGNQLPTPDASYQETLDPLNVLVTAPSKVEGDLRIKYKRPNGKVVTAVVTPVGAAFVGTDPRTLESLPVSSIRSMRQTIDLNDIDTMAYRAEKDIDEIISDEGGAFRFLSLDFPQELVLGERKYKNIQAAVTAHFAGPKTLKAMKKADTYDVPLEDMDERWRQTGSKFLRDALRAKFSAPQFQRWLAATGTRPFALPLYYGVDYNDALEALRSEALSSGVQPSAPPPAKPEFDRTAVLGAEQTAQKVQEASGYLRTRAKQRLAYSTSLWDPNAAEIVSIDPYALRAGEERPVDAIIYIRALGRKGIDKIPDTILAVTQPAIPYMVIDEPENVEDEGPARRAAKWLLEHPHWYRIGLAVASRSPYSKMIAAQTLDYLAMVEAELSDPDLRADASKEVSLRYTGAGNIISPIGGKVAGVVKGARGYKIAFESPVELTRDSLRKADLSRHTISELAETMATITEAITADDKFLRILEKADAEALAPLVEEAERRATADNRNVLSAVQEAKKKATNENIGNVGRLADSARDLKDEVRNLAISVNAAMDAATTRSGDMQKSFDPIVAAKRDRGELETALRYANTAAVLMGRYLQLVTRSVTSAEALGRLLRRQDLGQIGRHFRKILVTPGTGLSDRYKRHNNLIDTVQEQLREIPAELMSDSRSTNLKGLQKYYPYPGHEVEYHYVGPLLYRTVYLELPVGMEPVELRRNDILQIGGTIKVQGARTDIPRPREEQFSVDTIIVIAQDYAINCAPVKVKVIPIDEVLTDRAEIVDTVNHLLEKTVKSLRNQAAKTKALASDKEATADALVATYKKLGPNNFIDACSRRDYRTGEDVQVEPKFVEDPVFYCILTGPGGAYFVADGGVAPREASARQDFLENLEKKFGPDVVEHFTADTRRVMSDIPLDIGKIPLLKQMTGYQAMTIEKTILAGAAKTGFFEYSPARALMGKGLSATKKEAEKQLREKEVAGRFYATGTRSSGGTGAAGKVFIGKTDTPDKATPRAGGLGTAGKMAPGRYDPGTGGTMTLMLGREKLEDQMRKGYEVQTAYVVGGKDRWGRYMEQLDALRKKLAPTAKEIAMATYRAGQLAQDEGPDEPEAALENPMRRHLRNTNGDSEAPPPPIRRRRPAEGPPTAEQTPAARPADAAAAAASSPIPPRAPAGQAGFQASVSGAALEKLRLDTSAAWKAFVGALRDHEQKEPGARRVELDKFLKEYKLALVALETALSERDRRILGTADGEKKLRALLRAEAEYYMDVARASYTRSPRDGMIQPTQTQLERVAKWAAEAVSAFGRPLAPPSSTELAASGLSGTDLYPQGEEVAQRTSTSRARALPAAMSFSDLKQAAKIAAKAAKIGDKGISTSAVACRILQPEFMVAFKLASEPFNQLLFRKLGARKVVGKYRTVLLWFSPDSSHVIFYVNGIATCEFHVSAEVKEESSKFFRLVGEVLRYTEDWFNDPRDETRRQDYRVLAGKSGCPRLYQIREASPKLGMRNTAPFVANVAAEAMFSAGVLGDDPWFNCPEKAPIMSRVWATEDEAAKFDTTPEDMVKEEAKAYMEALTAAYGLRAAQRGSYGLAVGGMAAFAKATATEGANEVEVALLVPANHQTLFYPAMYGEGGVITRDNLSLTTGTELQAQLDGLVRNATDGAVFTVIDASMLSPVVFDDALVTFTEFDADDYFRLPTPSDIQRNLTQRVVPPAFYLLQQLARAKKENITINLIVRKIRASAEVNENTEANAEAAESLADPRLPVRLVVQRTAKTKAFEVLKEHFEHGSRLVLWNTPDMPDADAFFGQREGIRAIAEIAAETFGLIRQIVVESSGYERRESVSVDVRAREGATREERGAFLLSLPELIRKDIVDVVSKSISAGRGSGRSYADILGVPVRIGKLIEERTANMKPAAAAEIAINIMAEAYGGQGVQFVRYGPRFVPESRENRGRRLPRRR